MRGGVCGLMTTLGGIGHTLPSPAGLLHCSLGCGSRGGSRVRHHCLDKEALYGYSAAAGDFSGSARWRSRVHSGNSDRESLSRLRCELLRRFNRPSFKNNRVAQDSERAPLSLGPTPKKRPQDWSAQKPLSRVPTKLNKVAKQTTP
jgi:hypothetical protein